MQLGDTVARWMGTVTAFLFVMTVIGPGNAVAATKYKVFVLGGQSNSVGYNPGDAAKLPDSLKGLQNNVKFYGICGNGSVVGLTGGGSSCGKAIDGLTTTSGWLPLRPNCWAAAGTGCEVGSYVSFGHDMAKLLPNDSIAIVLGCDVCPFSGNGCWCSPSMSGGAGAMFGYLVNGVRKAIATGLPKLQAGSTAEIAGMMWVHGESDAGSADYQTQLTQFIKDIRDSLKVPNLPFVISKVAAEWDNTVVPAAQQNVAKTVPNTALVNTNGFPTANGGHYTGAGQVMLGNGFATEMMKLLKATSVREAPSLERRAIAAIKGTGITVDRPSTVVISDARGRTLRAMRIDAGSKIRPGSAGAGLVFVSVNNDRGAITEKLIVRRQDRRQN